MTERGSQASPTVIFTHLGKTGGATLRRIVPRNFPRSRVLSLRNPSSAPNGFLSTIPIDDFAGLPLADRERPRFIMAHMMFGLHGSVPRDTTYITLLRDPVSRVISGYKSALFSRGHRFHDTVIASKMDLADYVRSGLALEMDNSQTRAIAADVATPYGECNQDMLDRAKLNIEEHYAVVGIAERLDETLATFGHVFGWRRLHYVLANVSPNKIPRSSIPVETIAFIKHQNRFDIELYEYAVGRLERQIADDPGFDRHLTRFRRANTVYSPWGNLTYTLPVTVRSRLRAKGSPATPHPR